MYVYVETTGSAALYSVDAIVDVLLLVQDVQLKDPNGLKSKLQQIQSTGTRGILCDVWWGLTEKGPKQYNFTGYQQLADMTDSLGMKVKYIMSFHRCGGNVGDTCNIPLPSFVTSVGQQDSSIWYKDVLNNPDEEYISLFVDEMEKFDGRSPVQMYTDYMNAFKSSMGSRMGGVIEGIEVSMGPAGETRYPGYRTDKWKYCGVGGFQSYGTYGLVSVKKAAEAAGHPEWGMAAGPNDAGNYDDHPSNTGFFGSGNDNYQSDYGKFFLNWYQQQLLDHADRILGHARTVFGSSIEISAKISGIHWWYKDPSHAAELTSGYYNANNNNAYANFANVFASHGVTFTFTCLEMTDTDTQCSSGPFELVQQTKQAALGAGVQYTGENALPRYDDTAYHTIEEQSSNPPIAGFSYLRLGDTMLQSDNLQRFQQFVSAMNGISADK